MTRAATLNASAIRRVVTAAMRYFRDYHATGYTPRNLNISPRRRALFDACAALEKKLK